MKKIGFLLGLGLAVMALSFTKPAPTTYFLKKGGEVKFFSSAPMEDITALNHNSSAVFKTSDYSMTIKIPVKSFEFEKDLMYQHFLEKKYMWAEEYPYAEFKGALENPKSVNFEKDGTYDATVTGTMTIRGIAKEYKIPGTITIAGDDVECNAKFMVKLADHEVPIPKVVVKNIAEEVEVTVKLPMKKYVKK